MTCSVEGSTAFTAEETSGQHSYCRPPPVITPQQVFSLFADTRLLSFSLFPLPLRLLEPAQDLHQQTTQATIAACMQGTDLDPCGWPPLLCLHLGLDLPAVHMHTVGRIPITGSTATCILVVRSCSHESAYYQPRPPQLHVGLDSVLSPVTGLYH